jgi:hypothetical protein
MFMRGADCRRPRPAIVAVRLQPATPDTNAFNAPPSPSHNAPFDAIQAAWHGAAQSLLKAHARGVRDADRGGRPAMRCEARNAAMAIAIARMSNEADRPSPQMHTPLAS